MEQLTNINDELLDIIAPVDPLEKEEEERDIDRLIAELQHEADERGQYYQL